jgi:hypothetical protein
MTRERLHGFCASGTGRYKLGHKRTNLLVHQVFEKAVMAAMLRFVFCVMAIVVPRGMARILGRNVLGRAV